MVRIPILGVQVCSKSLLGSLVDSVFHPSLVDQISTVNSANLVIKSYLFPIGAI